MNKTELEQKELIEFEKQAKLDVAKIQHDYKMEEIEEEKRAKIEVEEAKHRHDLEMTRIKSAEIRKSQERRIGWK